MWASSADDYASVLQEFKTRFNENPRAQKLVTRWDRDVFLESADTGQIYRLAIRSQQLTDVAAVSAVAADGHAFVHLYAEEAVLRQVFSGKYNPATALVDGAMSVFSGDADKVKLEALAMVIWRLG